MRSKTAQFEIEATKRINIGHLPTFVEFAHKGLEKQQPEAKACFGADRTYIVPKDILKMAISDESIYEDISSLEFTYGLGGPKEE